MLDFRDLHHAVMHPRDAETVQSARALTRESRSLFGSVEHAEMAAAFEEGVRGLLADHASQPFLVGHEVDLALLVRAGDAECAESRLRSKQHTVNEHSPRGCRSRPFGHKNGTGRHDAVTASRGTLTGRVSGV